MLRIVTLTLTAVLLATDAKASDARTVFAYSTGSFERIGSGKWVEKRDGDVKSNFTEVERTKDFIELYDKSREMKVRLYKNVGKWYSEKDKEWVKWPGSEGSWK